jgi:glucose/arabinose dehydrogenase
LKLVYVIAIVAAGAVLAAASLLLLGGHTTNLAPSKSAPLSSDRSIPGSLYGDGTGKIVAKAYFKGPRLFPTSMAFLGPDDILVTIKDTGQVFRIVNGTMLEDPVVDVKVANKQLRGLLGMAISENVNGATSVFLYYTESGGGKDGNDNGVNATEPAGNRLYKYELNNGKLVNPELLLDLPAKSVSGQSATHNGGTVTIGPDGNVYLVIGDQGDKTITQNYADRTGPDGTGGILRIKPDGTPAKPILGEEYPLNLYYAYGIRNSFGMAFDPVTGLLWNTENGPTFGDEINLVRPGFNSGWQQVQGMWDVEKGNKKGEVTTEPQNLVDFGGKGKYHSPEFVWDYTVAPTAIAFLNSDTLGKDIENDMFVADYINGNIYRFELNKNRNAIQVKGDLADRVADKPSEAENLVILKGLGAAVDLKLGPDGYLYVLSFHKGELTIFKIVRQ